ncbi:MAG: hypothetical protein K2N84_05505, partial [Clostridia bacterium]|nr:hypothetical protein [Clostridia bacterium]
DYQKGGVTHIGITRDTTYGFTDLYNDNCGGFYGTENFFSDDPSKKIQRVSAAGELCLANVADQSLIEWEYDVVKPDGTKIETVSGNDIPVNSFNGTAHLRLEYDPNRRISEVRAKVTGDDGNLYVFSSLVDFTDWSKAGKNPTYATVVRHTSFPGTAIGCNSTDLAMSTQQWNQSKTDYFNNNYGVRYFSELVTADNGMYKPGQFSFMIDQQSYSHKDYGSNVDYSKVMNGKHISNGVFTIEIVPKNVNVTIDDKTSVYGEALETLTATTDLGLSASDIGLTLEKDPYYNIGIYNIRPQWNDGGKCWNTNKNYNIASITYGKYTITKREVTLILNDDWAEYATPITINEYFNNTQAKDAEGNPITDDGKPTGNPVYKGGWRYDTGSKEFVAEDLTTVGTNKKAPIELSSTAELTAAQISAGTFRDVKKYDINVVFTSYNLNYDVKFKTTAGDDILDSNTKRAQFEVRKATLSVNENLAPKDSNNKPAFKEATYNPSVTSATIALPDVTVVKKGNQNATVTIAYWDTVITKKEADDKATFTEPDNDPKNASKWDPKAPTIKNAGEYVIYVRIHVDNHEDLVYHFDFTIKAIELNYKIVVERIPKGGGAAVELSKKDGAYSDEYTGQAATARIDYIDAPSGLSSDPGQPVPVFYYLGLDNTYGKAGDADGFTDDSGNDEKGNARNFGNSNAPKDGGEYKATFVNTATVQNYVLKKATSEKFTITKKKVTVPTAPTATYYYNSTVQSIPLTSFDSTEMAFVEDTTNKYIAEPDPAPATHPVSDGTAALTFDKGSKTIKVKNAGTYEMKFKVSNDRNYVWDDNDASAERKVTITVKGAQIKSTWTNDLDGMPWVWEAGAQAVNITYAIEYYNESTKAYQATSPYQTGGTDDVVKVKLYWKEENAADTAKAECASSDITGTTLNIPANTTTFGTSGGYVLILEIDTTDAVSKNYAWDDTETDPTDRVTFTVDSASVNTSALSWEYISNKPNASKAQWTTTSELKFAYKDETSVTDLDGLSYTFNLKMGVGDKLPGAYNYISIDSTRYPTGAYKLEKYNASDDKWEPTTVLQDLGKYRWVVGLVIDASDTE